jgi:hypothetical protein
MRTPNKTVATIKAYVDVVRIPCRTNRMPSQISIRSNTRLGAVSKTTRNISFCPGIQNVGSGRGLTRQREHHHKAACANRVDIHVRSIGRIVGLAKQPYDSSRPDSVADVYGKSSTYRLLVLNHPRCHRTSESNGGRIAPLFDLVDNLPGAKLAPLIRYRTHPEPSAFDRAACSVWMLSREMDAY